MSRQLLKALAAANIAADEAEKAAKLYASSGAHLKPAARLPLLSNSEAKKRAAADAASEAARLTQAFKPLSREELKPHNRAQNALGLSVCAHCGGRLFVNGYCLACVDAAGCVLTIRNA